MVDFLELPALKVLLHAAKHPHAEVCGLLLGPAGNTSTIDDAVPLFHHTTVGPLLETAFMLVEQYALTKGKRLAGYYYAAAQADDPSTPPPSVLSVAKQLQSHYPGAVIIRVCNDKLGSRAVVPFEVVSVNEGAAGAAAAATLIVAAGGLQAFDKATQKGAFAAFRSLVDMDEHLDDAKRDFRNLHVARLL